MAVTKKGKLSKEQILKKSLELFAKKGFHETSFQDIANALKISQSALFHYFKNKLSLFETVINEIVLVNHQIAGEMIAIEDSAKIRLEKHFWANFNWAYNYPVQAKMLLLLYNQATTNAGLSQLAKKITEVGRGRIAEYLYMAQRENVLKPEINPLIWSEILHKYLLAFVFQMSSLHHENDVFKKKFTSQLHELNTVLFKD